MKNALLSRIKILIENGVLIKWLGYDDKETDEDGLILVIRETDTSMEISQNIYILERRLGLLDKEINPMVKELQEALHLETLKMAPAL